MATELTKRIREYAVCFLVWTVLGLFFFSQGLTQKFLSGEPSPWWHYLVSWLTGVYISALLTPLVLWAGRRFPFERRNWRRRVLIHLLFSLAFASIQLVSESALLFRFGVFPVVMKTFTATFFFLLMVGFHQNVLTYWTILGIQYAFRYYHAYRDRERQAMRLELNASVLQTQLARANLSALKMQLQPHFLFNTLNAVVVLIRQHRAREAEQMLARLSDLLRRVLDEVEEQEVPLSRELEYLRLYLSIEQVRFQDRLEIEIATDPDTLEALFPHMGLQPIVENAIHHGVGRRSAPGRIPIHASRVGAALKVIVEDNGPGLPAASDLVAPGIGLANTRARLNQLYGDAGRLTVENGAQAGVVATMSLPFRLAPQLSEMQKMEMHALDSIDR
jgi:two-component system LytT family sensor kinase